MADDIDIEEHGVMFPDLSIVKEEFDIEYDMEYELEASSLQPSTSAGVDDVIPDSTTDMYQEHGAPCEMTRAADSPHMVTSTQEDAAPPAIANCIILGSKPTPNCNIFNSRPSANCIIVGSRPNASPSIDYQHCTSATVPLVDWGQYLRDSRTYCRDCRTLFATVNALDAHKMHAHSFLVATDRQERAVPPPSPPVTVRESDRIVNTKCEICKERFSSERELITHIYDHLNTSLQCDRCPETFFSQQKLEEHKLVHSSEAVELFYRCHVCGLPSSKRTLYKRHMERFHNTVPENYEMYPLDLTCPHCERSTWTSLRCFRMHLRKHPQFYLKVKPAARVKSKPRFVTKLRTKLTRPKASNCNIETTEASKSNMEGGKSNLDDDSIVVPKSTLFRCSKCDVHFLNSSMAVSHYNTCNRNRIESYRCVRCKLHLKLSCQTAHLIQHKFANKFTALEISDEDIRPRILARCPKCAVHYSVQTLSSHVETCTSTRTNFFRCRECLLQLDERLRRSHEFNHQKLNYKANDFITIGYKERRSMIRYKFYYCRTCKCFMNLSGKYITNHMKGLCRNYRRNGCSVCGLMMTWKSLGSHRRLHGELENYNLGNFKFYNLDDRKPMRPLPEYHRCKKCNIHFHAKIDLTMGHKCSNTRFQKCHICNVKYSDSAYKLHMAFHDIEAPAPEETSQTIQEKGPIAMYYCDVCKSYLHQKYHRNKFDNCKLVKKYLCSICGLLCCSRNTHQKLHRDQKFKLHDITFYSIPDLKLIKPPAPKYRQCTKCRVHYTLLRFEKHKCGQENSIKCRICDISLSKRAYKLHMPFHSYTNSTKKSTGDPPVPKLLPKRVTLEKNLKIDPISSKRPGPSKNIVKEKYTRIIEKSPVHYLNQTAKRSIETFRKATRRNDASTIDVNEDITDESYTRDTEADDVVFTFYQCRTCHICLTTKRHDHICATKTDSRIICVECGLKFNKGVYKNHKRDHENPKFMLENFKIIPFSVEPETASQGQNDNNEEASEDVNERTHETNRPATRRRGYTYMCTFYQCSSCKICVYEEENIKRHKCVDQEDFNIYKCDECGLYLRKSVQDMHRESHEINPEFIYENFKIIPFYNKPTEANHTGTYTRKDYTFYQCSACSFCVTDRVELHSCATKHPTKRVTCELCGLFISKLTLKKHLNAHKVAPSFVRENFTVVPFSPKKSLVNDTTSDVTRQGDATVEDSLESVADDDLDNTDRCETASMSTDAENEEVTKTDINTRNLKFYQCIKCKLCLRNYGVALRHKCITKFQSLRLTCRKCRLCLDSRNFKSHLIDHKNNRDYKFEIVPFVPSRFKGRLSYKCPECGLIVATHRYLKHLETHDQDPSITRANSENIPVSAKTIHKEAEGTLEETECTAQHENSANDEVVVPLMKLKLKKRIFYKCTECKGCLPEDRVPEHYVNKLCATLPDTQYCEICENKFPYYWEHVTLHKKLHHHSLNLTLISINNLDEYFDKINKKCVYQCYGCKTILFSQIEMEQHKDSCSITQINDVTVCRKCRLSICNDEESLATHETRHQECAEFVHEHITVVHFDSSGMITDKGKTRTHILYECVNCKVCLMTNEKLANHITNRCNNMKSVRCKHCDYLIHKQVLGRHNSLHAQDPNMSRSNILVIPFGEKGVDTIYKEGKREETADNENSLKRVVTRTFKKHIFYKCTECKGCLPEDRVAEHYVNKLCATLPDTRYCEKCENKFPYYWEHVTLHKKLHQHSLKLTLISINNLDEFFDKINKKCVYQCYGCKTILFSRIEMEQHKDSCSKTEINDVTVCRKCRLVVCSDEESLATHETRHQECSEFVHEHITVVHFDSSGMITDTKKTEVHILHECVKCKVCFTTQMGVANHMRSQCINATHKCIQCKPCGILINKHALPRHNYYLHSRKMTPPKILVIPFGEKRPETTDQEDAVNEEEPAEEMELDEQVSDANQTRYCESDIVSM